MNSYVTSKDYMVRTIYPRCLGEQGGVACPDKRGMCAKAIIWSKRRAGGMPRITTWTTVVPSHSKHGPAKTLACQEMTCKSDALLAVGQESCKDVCIKHIDQNFPTWEAGILHAYKIAWSLWNMQSAQSKTTKSLGNIERQ